MSNPKFLSDISFSKEESARLYTHEHCAKHTDFALRTTLQEHYKSRMDFQRFYFEELWKFKTRKLAEDVRQVSTISLAIFLQKYNRLDQRITDISYFLKEDPQLTNLEWELAVLNDLIPLFKGQIILRRLIERRNFVKFFLGQSPPPRLKFWAGRHKLESMFKLVFGVGDALTPDDLEAIANDK